MALDNYLHYLFLCVMVFNIRKSLYIFMFSHVQSEAMIPLSSRATVHP